MMKMMMLKVIGLKCLFVKQYLFPNFKIAICLLLVLTIARAQQKENSVTSKT